MRQLLCPGTLYLPYATSLRMGRLGYQSDAQSSLAVSYNSLEGYAHSLQGALTQPYPAYEAIGVQGPDGVYRQLGTTLLQIENEFYGTIRPKRVTYAGERPLHALRERGVEYVEVRLMDLDPFEPMGISAPTMRFLDMFLLHCLSSDSPPDTPEEIAAMSANQQAVAQRGREPGLQLTYAGASVGLQDWGVDWSTPWPPLPRPWTIAMVAWPTPPLWTMRVLASCTPKPWPQPACCRRCSKTTAARLWRLRGLGLKQCALRCWRLELPAHIAFEFTRESQASWDDQRVIEAADTLPFEQYRQEYLSPDHLVPRKKKAA